MNPRSPQDSPTVIATSRTWGGTWVRTMVSAKGKSGNQSCTWGPGRELGELRDNRGEIVHRCKYPNETKLLS